MTAKTIVEHLDVFKDILSGLGLGSILLMKDQLSFEGAKETFDGCIVVTISFAAHGNRTHHSSLCQQSLILAAGVLTAPVRMMQQARRRLANGDGHLQSVNDQLPVQAITHGPAHNAPGVKVQDHCQIEPPLCGRHISDINGMITNDKFCLSRNGQLQLSWSRIGLYECRRSQRPKVGYPSRNTDHSGGKCETTMASSSPDQSEIGRAATLGSGLSTATEVEPGARAEQLAADQNHPNANSGDT